MKYRFISADYLRNNLNKYIIVDVREKKLMIIIILKVQ